MSIDSNKAKIEEATPSPAKKARELDDEVKGRIRRITNERATYGSVIPGEAILQDPKNAHFRSMGLRKSWRMGFSPSWTILERLTVLYLYE